MHVFILTAPDDRISRGKRDLGSNRPHGVLHVRPDIDVLDVDIDPFIRAGVFRSNHHRPLACRNRGKLANRDLVAGWRRNQHPLKCVDIVAKFSAVAEVYGVSFETFHSIRDAHSANGGFNDVLHIANRQTVSRGFASMNVKIEVVPSYRSLRKCAQCARHLPHNGFHLPADLLKHSQIGTGDFDPDGSLDSGA